MTALAVLVGVTLTLWLCTVLAVGYTIYRYVWQPWKVVRADIAALNTKHETFRAEVMQQIESRRARVAGAFGNEELASIEESLLADSRRRRAETGVVR